MTSIKKYLQDNIRLILICCIWIGRIVLDGWLHIRDLRYDESYTLFIIQKSRAQLRWYIVQDVHQPLYYRLVKLRWSIVWYSDAGIRAFSVLPYIGVIILSYKISYRCVPDKLFALIVAAAVMANPFLREYAQEARMYSLLVGVWIFVIYRSLQLIQWESLKHHGWYIGIGIMTGFLLHYFSFLYWLWYLVLLFIVLIRQSPWKWKWLLLSGWMMYVPLLLSFGICLPLIMHQYSSGYVWSVLQPMTLEFILRSLGIFFVGHEQGALGIQPINELIWQWGSRVVGLFALMASGMLIIWMLRRLIHLITYKSSLPRIFLTLAGRMALAAVIVLSILKWTNMYVERYLIFLTPLLIYSLCIGAYSVQKYIGYIVAWSILLLPLFIEQPSYVRNGIRDYAKTIQQLQIPAVAVKSDLDYLVARYYLEYYGYTGTMYVWTQDVYTPERSIYKNTTPRIKSLHQLSWETAILGYGTLEAEWTWITKLPYDFGFAHIYLYSPPNETAHGVLPQEGE